MKTRRPLTNHFAICIDNAEYPASLEKHKIYRIIQDKDAEQDGDLRVIDESGEDYLYPSERFVMVDLPRDIVRVLNKSFSQGLHQVS
jgi:hypothetical protein